MDPGISPSRRTAAFNTVAAGKLRRLARMLREGLPVGLESRRAPAKGALLERAVAAGHRDCARLLVAHGAQPGAREWLRAIAQGDAWAGEQASWSPRQADPDRERMVLQALCIAPDGATAARVMALVNHAGDGLHDELARPLVRAIRDERFEVAHILLDAGACPNVGFHALVQAPMTPGQGAHAAAIARRCLAAGATPGKAADGHRPPKPLLPGWSVAGYTEGVELLLDHGMGQAPCGIAGTHAQLALVAVLSSQGWRAWIPREVRAAAGLLLARGGASLDAPPIHGAIAYPTLRAWAAATYPAWAAVVLDDALPPAMAAGGRERF